MATHAKRSGSRKVEPKQVREWQAKLNYILRELAKAYYGKPHNEKVLEQFDCYMYNAFISFVEDGDFDSRYRFDWQRSDRAVILDALDSIHDRCPWLLDEAENMADRLVGEFEELASHYPIGRFVNSDGVRKVFDLALSLYGSLDAPTLLKPLSYYLALPVYEYDYTPSYWPGKYDRYYDCY
jgi:hypothetical protein